MKTTRLSAALVLAALAGTVHAQCDTATLNAQVPGPNDGFGRSMAMKSGVLVVGNPLRSYSNSIEQGTASIFTNILGWTAQAEITMPEPDDGVHFGHDVDVSGDWIVAGAPNYAQSVGAALFFKRVGAGWQHKTTLQMPMWELEGHAGSSVAIDGDYAIIGVPNADPTPGGIDDGLAMVAVRVGDAWQDVGYIYIDPVQSTSHLGASVAVRGNRFIAGAPNRNVSGLDGAGAVALTTPKATTYWAQDALLTAADPQSGANLGSSVAIGDDIVVAGAPSIDSGIIVNCGAVYIFEPNQLGIWIQTAKITPPAPSPNGFFGGHVALDGDRIVVTEWSTGKVFVYRKSQFDVWIQEWRLHDPVELGQGFAGAIAVSGDKVAVSSILGEVNGITEAGYVNVFDIGYPIGSDSPVFAPLVPAGTYTGCTEMATNDGDTTCGNTSSSPDVYFKFIAPCTGNVQINTFGSDYDTVLSVHTQGSSSAANTVACNDDTGQFFTASSLTVHMTQGQQRYIRVSGKNGASGNYSLTITACSPATCYANCDASTTAPVLTANDFTCFLTKYAAGASYANCDGVGGLTANDFACFLTAFATGCT